MIRAHPALRSIQPASATSGTRAVWAGHLSARGRGVQDAAFGFQGISNRALTKLTTFNGANQGTLS